MKLAVVGGTNMDILGIPEGNFLPRDSNPGRVELRPGGVGRNIAAQIAALGEYCLLFTALGDDSLSDVLRNDCRRRGIDLSHALRCPGRGCVYLAIHGTNGDMLTAINDMALTACLDEAYLRESLDTLNGCGLCVADANLPPESLRFLADHAEPPLLCDPVSRAKCGRVRDILPRLFAIKPNLYEAQTLTGKETPADCAEALLNAGVEKVFISLGEDGLYFADRQQAGRIPVERFSDAPKTGAGDALTAGLAVALAQGKTTEEAARFAQHCAFRFLTGI